MNAIMAAAMEEMEKATERIDFAGGGFVTADDVMYVALRVRERGFGFAEAYQAANVAEGALMRVRRERQ